jgi:DNA-binding MarR family transcriptional regulator
VSSQTPTIEPGSPDALELGELYIHLYQRVRKMADDAMLACGVSLSRTKVLKLLSVRGPVTQAAIAVEFGFAPRSITDLVDGLEREGLAERIDNPGDRRSRLVRITDSGAIALESALTTKRELFEQIFSALDAPSRTALCALLETVYTSVSAHPSAAGQIDALSTQPGATLVH